MPPFLCISSSVYQTDSSTRVLKSPTPLLSTTFDSLKQNIPKKIATAVKIWEEENQLQNGYTKINFCFHSLKRSQP